MSTSLARHLGDPDWVVVDCRFTLDRSGGGARRVFAVAHSGRALRAISTAISRACPSRPTDGIRCPSRERFRGDARQLGRRQRLDRRRLRRRQRRDRGAPLVAAALARPRALRSCSTAGSRRGRPPAARRSDAPRCGRDALRRARAPRGRDGRRPADEIAGDHRGGRLARRRSRAPRVIAASRSRSIPSRATCPGARESAVLGERDRARAGSGRRPSYAPSSTRCSTGATRAELVAMCGSGVTACHLLLAMAVAGLDGGRLYAGSWSEWIRDPRRPIQTGLGAVAGGGSRIAARALGLGGGAMVNTQPRFSAPKVRPCYAIPTRSKPARSSRMSATKSAASSPGGRSSSSARATRSSQLNIGNPGLFGLRARPRRCASR